MVPLFGPRGFAMPYAQIDDVTFMLLILVGSLLLGIGATVLFRGTVPGLMARMYRTDDAERKYLDLLKEGYVVRNRVRGLQSEFSQLENQRARLESDLRKLQRQIAQAASAAPDFVHEVGEPRAGQSKYVARLSVDASSPQLRSTSDTHNPMWYCVNLAEVWAGSRDEARQLLELAYSDKLGYQKVMIDSRERAEDQSR